MIDFLIISGMVLWAAFCIACLFIFPFILWEEGDLYFYIHPPKKGPWKNRSERSYIVPGPLTAIIEFALAVIMSVGWFFVGFGALGWVADETPADGCYHLYTHDSGIWIKGVYYPNPQTEYIPIHCPEGS